MGMLDRDYLKEEDELRKKREIEKAKKALNRLDFFEHNQEKKSNEIDKPRKSS